MESYIVKNDFRTDTRYIYVLNETRKQLCVTRPRERPVSYDTSCARYRKQHRDFLPWLPLPMANTRSD